MMTRLPIALMLWLLLSAAAWSAEHNPERAVGKANGCSFVVIDPFGWALSAEHCPMEAGATGELNGQQIVIERVWDSAPKQGVDDGIVLKISGSGHDYAPLAASMPRPGDRVMTIGYPAGKRVRKTGTVASVTDTAIHCDFPLSGGHSGGPLFNARGEVIGLAWATSPYGSSWVTLHRARTQLMAADFKPHSQFIAENTLYVLTAPNCSPCSKFEADHRAGKFGSLKVEYVQVGSPRANQLFPGVYTTPTFKLQGQTQQGYREPADIIGFVATVLRVGINAVRALLGLLGGDEPIEPIPEPVPEPDLGTPTPAPPPPEPPPEPLPSENLLDKLGNRVAEADRKIDLLQARLEDSRLPPEIEATLKDLPEIKQHVDALQNGSLPAKIRAGLALKSEVQELKDRVPQLKEEVGDKTNWLAIVFALLGFLRRRGEKV